MVIFLDESGDLGWSFDKPRRQGGSSRFMTIAGIEIEKNKIKHLCRFVHALHLKYNLGVGIEVKGLKFSDDLAARILKDIQIFFLEIPSLKVMSITADKQKTPNALRRDKNVFYNYISSALLTDILNGHNDGEVIFDDRTIRRGSRNSLEDCLKSKCWGELGLTASISCRYEDSKKNPGIWVADWLANFIWRHYENNLHEAYDACLQLGDRYHEKTLFM